MAKKKPRHVSEAEEPVEYAAKIDLNKAAIAALVFLTFAMFAYDVFYLLPDANPTAFERLKTIALFAVMSYGLGYTVLAFVRKPEDPFEKHFMTFGIGLSVLPILTLVLDTLGIPLDSTLMLALSLIYPGYAVLIKNQKIGVGKYAVTELLENKNALAVMAVVLLASLYLFVLLKGALALPYLEDDDSWDHAVGAKYVSIAKQYSLPEGVPVTHYMEPYPPTYDGIMGLLHQHNSSVQWTLKFFNALLIALSVVMAYYFIRLFTGDWRIALGGSFILTAAPCYLSHFIWAHTLGHVLFYPAFYAVEMADKDWKWALPATLAVASVTVTQPMISLVFGVFYILYYVTRAVVQRKLLKQVLLIGVVGLLLAVVFFWGQMVLKYGSGFEKVDGAGRRIQSGEFKIAFEKRTIPLNEILLVESFDGSQPDGCATLVPGRYCIPLSGNIAIQKGFGVVLFGLFVLSILIALLKYRSESFGGGYWVPVSLVWAAFTLVGLESWALPVSVDPPRFFMFMTLPMALLVPKGVLALAGMLKKHVKPEYVVALLVVAVLYTSAYPKYVVQTAFWPYGVMWKSSDQVQGYLAIKDMLPPETKVFPMCMPDSSIIGLDKLSFPWDGDVVSFRDSVAGKSPAEIHSFLKEKGYGYVILDISCVFNCVEAGGNSDACISKVNEIAKGMSDSGLFASAWSNSAVLLYKLK